MTLRRFIDNPRFPDSVAVGAKGGPSFETNVFIGNTGIEQRVARWRRCRHQYLVDLGIRTDADMVAARNLAFSVAGRGVGFRFKDWADYQLSSENIGTGDGVEDTYYVTKTYTFGALSYERRIYKIVPGTASVRVNSVLQVEDTDYTLEYNTGVITFLSIPANGHAVTITCEFDVPVRLNADEIDFEHVGFQAQRWPSIPLIEVHYSEAEYSAAALSLDFSQIDNSQFVPTNF